ncbi:SGNH hydrolase domain-containing protein [Pseudoclavibacter sp. 13-3]|uniref:SGNH hydrolase domain-containing protein n=1 Tax=Pseudoclavibacter sp. 13-3 TaxID=2901228 RepID=UPI003FA70476
MTDAEVVDTHRVICPEGRCHMVVGGLVVYTDSNHLTGSYSLSPEKWFSAALRDLDSVRAGE